MVDDTIEQTKAAMRLKAHQARAGFSEQEQADAAEAICRHFFRDIALRPGDVVAAYWRIRDEIDCGPILVRLMDSGYTVVLPVVLGAGQPLEMRVWEPGAALYPSGFGTLAPSPLAPQRQPDMVLLPVLGFDRLGTRLGYGGGYYDRTLAQMGKTPRLIGLAFSAQEFDIVPRLPHDIPLHAIVTESGVRQFGSGL